MLLVDDHEDSLAMYSIGLLAMGFQPVTAKNADEGFAQACACHPEVVVADLMMPVVSGFELMRRLRLDPRTSGVPIIALTGDPLSATLQHARQFGCDRFLLKPCVPAMLAIEIRDVLASRGLRSVPAVVPAAKM